MQKIIQINPPITDLKIHSKYRNIIFDLGRVLFHVNPDKVVTDFFGHEDPVPFGLTKSMFKVWADVDRGVISPDGAAQILAQEYDKQKVDVFLGAVLDRLTPIDQGVSIFKAIKQKGYKTYILSNLSQQSHNKISGYDFMQDFDGAVFSYQYSSIKPEPAIYQALLNLYNLKPEECLFIDDLPDNIAAAKTHGIDGIICSDHAYVREQLLDLHVL
ncbi:MAG: HAD family phosphatase [bacterium]